MLIGKFQFQCPHIRTNFSIISLIGARLIQNSIRQNSPVINSTRIRKRWNDFLLIIIWNEANINRCLIPHAGVPWISLSLYVCTFALPMSNVCTMYVLVLIVVAYIVPPCKFIIMQLFSRYIGRFSTRRENSNGNVFYESQLIASFFI